MSEIASGFPAPDELEAQHQAAVAGDVERLRAKVLKAFQSRPYGGKPYEVDVEGFPRLAIDMIIAELSPKWDAELKTTYGQPQRVYHTLVITAKD